MKKFFLIGTFLVTALGFSQNQGSIKGNILDKEMHNEPLLFANVQLKGSDKKTETNFHGNFEFNDLEAGKHTLLVTYVGYESIEMPILVEEGKTTQVQLGLVAKTFDLGDVSGIAVSSKDKLTTAPGLD
ncbi:carboxypeptidase-like regulatory domain-containing protein [Maribacter halichondriae]|uniref:carboxypeptidase-like regulatory domain-containing protein n=1 Tax=Maribacter halichondriae TaxID=2980554 RepID=UPI0023598F35|nr:carboxypeptidase-like regulatory domain-containing protein [Maribacter sp. Hal144]